MKKALIVIDAQKEYYAGGGYPLWNMDATIANIKKAMAAAKEKNIPIILIQHVFPKDSGMPIFIEGTPNDQIAEEILAEAPGAPIVQKADADSFYHTNLEEVLSGLGVEELIITGMMTHNCVVFTSLSKSAEKYQVKLIPECTTTIDPMVHNFALAGLSVRVPFVSIEEAFS
ncbi:cysteine hydrolase family protein [Pseudoflavonifractor phocaeensis]|uniref:cysteine hydrolase family protein n=1 Tax=Pseudoflavonifractor phocaeensis TaxID=1870988 RepID=UPI0019591B7F|nr:isochorismatase family protein [Pseudoflavonifractor phocaeensis]MBM6884570.1 isochorismatase family protein [Pseudoflavonifractor phocaeensis]